MSNQVNTELLELAGYHLSYWEGEGIGALIQADIDNSDLASLESHLKASAQQMFDLEYQPESTDIY